MNIRIILKTLLICIPLLTVCFVLFIIFTTPQEPKELEKKPDRLVENSIEVKDQMPGYSIFVEDVLAKETGYIGVYPIDEKGYPVTDQMIGFSERIIGARRDLEIGLGREVIVGEQFIAILHKDNGDELFVFPGPDEPVTEEDGTIVSSKFSIIEASEEETESNL